MSNNPTRILNEASAWDYLGTTEVGRLATVLDNKAHIFPINFCIDGESVIFRTAEGSKLDEILKNNAVAFEADGWDEEAGWSVILTGNAQLITDEDELRRAQMAPLRPWVPTVKTNWVRIEPDEISGRAFYFGPEPTQNK